jgi:hypothetical protein
MDMVVDAPYRLEAGSKYLPIVIYVKDVKANKIKLKSIKIRDYDKTHPDKWVPVPQDAIHSVLDVEGKKVEKDGRPSILRLDPNQNQEKIRSAPWYRIVLIDKTKLNKQTGKHLAYDNATYIQYMVRIVYKGTLTHKKKYVLRTILSEHDLPKFEDWHYGDTHYHSEFTDNPYEYGGPLRVTAVAAKALGLSWVTITDHSYGLTRPKTDEEKAAGNRWLSYRQTVSKINDEHEDLLLVGAEEVTVREHLWGLHLLSFGNDFIKDKHPAGFGTLTMKGMFDKLHGAPDENQGFIFAAHPSSSGYKWEGDDYTTAVDPKYEKQFLGLQIFNEKIVYSCTTKHSMDRDCLNPFEMITEKDRKRPWSQELRSGIDDHWVNRLLLPSLEAAGQGSPLRKYFILAGSDCHMDFNFSFRPHPAFMIHHLNDNAFGKVRSLAHIPGSGTQRLTEAQVLEALRTGRVVLTDGPAVLFSVKPEGSQKGFITGETATLTDGSDLELTVEWKSNSDIGNIEKFRLLLGTPNGEQDISDEIKTTISDGMSDSFEGRATHVFKNWAHGLSYLRIEAMSRKGTVPDEFMSGCFSNPIWIVKE